MNEYLTTRELADLLRIKERKVYDLASSGAIPCSRAMGKLLFPRQAVNAWLAQGTAAGGIHPPADGPPGVFLGSHDPLLEWVLRESQCGLATYFDGSLDGLDRFAAGEGVATSLHVYVPDSDDWNVPLVRARCGDRPVVLVEWARRDRGLIVARGAAGQVRGIADLAGRRVVPRQAEAGSQQLLEHLLDVACVDRGAITFTAPARTEADAALAVFDGKADVALGLKALAFQYRLSYVPLMTERFDLLVDRRAWFEPPFQAFLAFCRSDAFARRLAEMRGYDTQNMGQVRFNGA